MTNPFVHVELNSPEPEKAKAFYAKLFQWQLEDMPNPAVPDHSYTVIKVGEGTGGGIMKQVPHGPTGFFNHEAPKSPRNGNNELGNWLGPTRKPRAAG